MLAILKSKELWVTIAAVIIGNILYNIATQTEYDKETGKITTKLSNFGGHLPFGG